MGSHAVDTLIVILGESLRQLGVLEHVTRDHDFSDADLFYRFLHPNARGSVEHDADGHKIDWTQFLTKLSNNSSSSLQPQLPVVDFANISPKDVHVASKIWPLDQFNTDLLNHVHPPNWNDPIPTDTTYDMVVIGGGTAGLITAAGAAGVGAKVALIEEHLLGGDCLNVGCVPSKTLIHAANLAHTVRI